MNPIPVTALIICAALMVTLLMLQHYHYKFLEMQKSSLPPKMDYSKHITVLTEKVAKIQVDLTEVNARVDVLMLKAGFKV